MNQEDLLSFSEQSATGVQSIPIQNKDLDQERYEEQRKIVLRLAGSMAKQCINEDALSVTVAGLLVAVTGVEAIIDDHPDKFEDYRKYALTQLNDMLNAMFVKVTNSHVNENEEVDNDGTNDSENHNS